MNAKLSRQSSKTDWARVDAMKDEEIDYSDNPKLDAKFFREAVWWPGPKKQITLRLDPDVLAFFKAGKALSKQHQCRSVAVYGVAEASRELGTRKAFFMVRRRGIISIFVLLLLLACSAIPASVAMRRLTGC